MRSHLVLVRTAQPVGEEEEARVWQGRQGKCGQEEEPQAGRRTFRLRHLGFEILVAHLGCAAPSPERKGWSTGEKEKLECGRHLPNIHEIPAKCPALHCQVLGEGSEGKGEEAE